MSPPAELLLSLADRYRVERELGAGGMATVYLAHDLKHDRDVAIKVLHSDLGAALGAERFLSEIRTTARLQHPHILPLLDSGEADGLLYYVMPVVTGESLRARLERERQLPIADAVRLACEIASALDYAHRHGVIHRESRPFEVFVRSLANPSGGKWAISTSGGTMPRWSHKGDELFDMDLRSNLVAVRVTTAPSFAVQSRRVLFDASNFIQTSVSRRNYDVSRDDQRFLMVQRADGARHGQVVVVEHWPEEMRRKAPPR